MTSLKLDPSERLTLYYHLLGTMTYMGKFNINILDSHFTTTVRSLESKYLSEPVTSTSETPNSLLTTFFTGYNHSDNKLLIVCSTLTHIIESRKESKRNANPIS